MSVIVTQHTHVSIQIERTRTPSRCITGAVLFDIGAVRIAYCRKIASVKHSSFRCKRKAVADKLTIAAFHVWSYYTVSSDSGDTASALDTVEVGAIAKPQELACGRRVQSDHAFAPTPGRGPYRGSGDEGTFGESDFGRPGCRVVTDIVGCCGRWGK